MSFPQQLAAFGASFHPTFVMEADGELAADRAAVLRVVAWWNQWRLLIGLILGVHTELLELPENTDDTGRNRRFLLPLYALAHTAHLRVLRFAQ